MRQICDCILLVALAAPMALGQSSSASILGVVKDSSDAVVPSVRVTATQAQTNQVFHTVTTAEGYYQIPSLPVGTYRVDVEAPGFKRAVRSGIGLQVDEKVRVDFALEAGSVSESITVNAGAVLVDTADAVVKQVIDSHRILELPLNGRNMLELQLLGPGVYADPAAAGNTGGYSVNGGRGNTVNYQMDGGDNNDSFRNLPGAFPMPDAVEEFSLQTNNYSSEYGHSTGAIMNVITRSGTNQYHGNLFEFLRNDQLNARNFFSASVPKLRQNQFGGTFGGPLSLPKIYKGKDRTFFFVAYQATRIRQESTLSNVFVPTPAERKGDYSASARKPTDPANGAPFPGNVIPASRFDPVATKFLDLFVPLPNLPNGQFTANLPAASDANQGILRIDHSVSSSHKIYGRSFNHSIVSSQSPNSNLPAFRSTTEYHEWNLTVGDSLIIRPTLVNSFSVTMNRTKSYAGNLMSFHWEDLGMKLPSAAPPGPTSNTLGVTGAFGFASAVDFVQPRTVLNLQEAISYSKGAHFLKAGFDYRNLREISRGDTNVNGVFSFTGQFSGVPTADFLLGRPASLTQGGSLFEGLPRQTELAWFLQDDWKLTSRFTLNLGVRFEPYLPIVDQHDHRTSFRAGQQSSVFPTAPTGLVYPGDAGITRGIIPAHWKHLAPRFGFAWDPFGKSKTVVRGGYGIFFGTPADQNNQGYVSPPYSVQYLTPAPRSFSDPYAGITPPIIPYLPPQTAQQKATYNFGTALRVDNIAAGFRNSYFQQYNLNVEQQLPGELKLTLAYIGAKGTALQVGREGNPAIYGPAATVANTNARRLYAPYFTSVVELSAAGTSLYSAFQANVVRKFSRGFTLLASYSFGKSLDTVSNDAPNVTGYQNSFDLRSERGRSAFDVQHGFNGSFVWEMPFFSRSSRLLKGTLGGWQLSGLARIQTGFPFSVLAGRDNSLSGNNKDRANLVGDPSLPGGRPRADTIAQFFNVAAFAQAPTGAFGNAGRDILTGPGLTNFDFSLVKSFAIRERAHLQFRAEAFNAFNNVNLGLPASTLTGTNVGRIGAAGSPKIWQGAMKLRF